MTARVDLASLLGKASEFARLWQTESAHALDDFGKTVAVLDDLADAVVSYLGDNPQLARAGAEALRRDGVVIIDDPVRDEGRVFVREATDAEQREALRREGVITISKEFARKVPGGFELDLSIQVAHERQALEAAHPMQTLNATPHVELQVQHLPLRGLYGLLVLRNDSTVALEVVRNDGSIIGFPPSAVGEVGPGETVRTPPGGDWTRPRPVSDRELAFAQKVGREAHRRGADYLWAQRLTDGRGVFLMPWNHGGVQLSVGLFGDMTFHGTWYYEAENADVGWREALGWDVGQREPRHLSEVSR